MCISGGVPTDKLLNIRKHNSMKGQSKKNTKLVFSSPVSVVTECYKSFQMYDY